MDSVQDEIVRFKLDIVRGQLLAEFPPDDVERFVKEDTLTTLLKSGASLRRTFREAETAIYLRGRPVSVEVRHVLDDRFKAWQSRMEWAADQTRKFVKQLSTMPEDSTGDADAAPRERPRDVPRRPNQQEVYPSSMGTSRRGARDRHSGDEWPDAPYWVVPRPPEWRILLAKIADVLFGCLLVATIGVLSYAAVVLYRAISQAY